MPKSRARRPSIPFMAPGSDVRRPTGVLAGDEPDGEERRGRKEPRRGRIEMGGERSGGRRESSSNSSAEEGRGEWRGVSGWGGVMPRMPARN